jgi:hypothetical protein
MLQTVQKRSTLLITAVHHSGLFSVLSIVLPAYTILRFLRYQKTAAAVVDYQSQVWEGSFYRLLANLIIPIPKIYLWVNSLIIRFQSDIARIGNANTKTSCVIPWHSNTRSVSLRKWTTTTQPAHRIYAYRQTIQRDITHKKLEFYILLLLLHYHYYYLFITITHNRINIVREW